MLIENRYTTTVFYRYLYAGKLVTCQQQFVQLHHVVLNYCGNKDQVSVFSGTFSENCDFICISVTLFFSVSDCYETSKKKIGTSSL